MVLLVILLAALACSLQNQLFARRAGLSGRNDYLRVAPPGSTATPTPFQPVPPTPILTPDPNNPGSSSDLSQQLLATLRPTPTLEYNFTGDKGRTWQDYPGPSVWPDMDIPGPVGVLTHPDGQVNILLLGSDQRPYDGGFRTDTIQLVTINQDDYSVKLTAFPRDLYVYIPGDTMQRINTAMAWGGFDALALTMEYNFGVHPDYYVLINFWSFKDVIDSIGGISVDVGRDFCDQRDAYGWYCLSQSTVWMDGETALWYVRSRHSTDDLDRGRRQQEVLKAIFDQVMSLDSLQHASDLYDVYKQNVTTNMDFGEITKFFPVAYNQYRNHSIQDYSIGDAQVYDWTTPSGAMVLVPIRDQVLEVMRQVITEP